ncbi:unnamed protein product [Amoebophrya sp. A25]|nr:unnamed protein product [Amoebophrya sp. A25]|eukprot:GSA25T00025120001.1
MGIQLVALRFLLQAGPVYRESENSVVVDVVPSSPCRVRVSVSTIEVGLFLWCSVAQSLLLSSPMRVRAHSSVAT